MDPDLKAILSRYPASASPAADPVSLGNAGGLSGSRLWRYPSVRGKLVARAWPADGPPREALAAIHRWQAAAGPLGFVAVPLESLTGETFHERGGRLWEVAPWMPGGPETAVPPRVERVRAAFAALGALHQRLAAETVIGPSVGLRRRFEELSELSDRDFAAVRAWAAPHAGDPLRGFAARWVDLARPRAPGVLNALRDALGRPVARQPCLRDVRPDHVLFEGDRVSALLDFGAAGLEAVAGDVARLLSGWLGRDATLRAAAVAAYDEIRPLSPAETDLIAVFERSAALLGPAHWLRWHFVEGRRFEDPDAVRNGLETGLTRLAGSVPGG